MCGDVSIPDLEIVQKVPKVQNVPEVQKVQFGGGIGIGIGIVSPLSIAENIDRIIFNMKNYLNYLWSPPHKIIPKSNPT